MLFDYREVFATNVWPVYLNKPRQECWTVCDLVVWYFGVEFVAFFRGNNIHHLHISHITPGLLLESPHPPPPLQKKLHNLCF